MTPDGAKEKLASMQAEFATKRECPCCHVGEGIEHLRNCLWAAEAKGLLEFIEKTEGPGPLQGPNLHWGDPCGTYEFELVPGGALLFYRQKQLCGGMLEIKIPFSLQAAAEMQALIGMIDFGIKIETPNGRIAGQA